MIGMKLNQIEKMIDPIILEQGEAYRKNGHILSVNEGKPRLYYAEVVGSDLYDVEIQLGSTGEVTYTLCECPYDKGPICKHAAAVLLELGDVLASIDKGKPVPKNKSAAQKNIAEQLSMLSKEELIALILNFSDEYNEIEQALSLKFIAVDNKESLNQGRNEPS